MISGMQVSWELVGSLELKEHTLLPIPTQLDSRSHQRDVHAKAMRSRGYGPVWPGGDSYGPVWPGEDSSESETTVSGLLEIRLPGRRVLK